MRIGSDDVKPIRNDFEEDLRVALESIAQGSGDTGTLVWTPAGQAQRTLTVRHNLRFGTGRTDNNLTETWSCGLFAASPDWT